MKSYDDDNDSTNIVDNHEFVGGEYDPNNIDIENRFIDE